MSNRIIFINLYHHLRHNHHPPPHYHQIYVRNHIVTMPILVPMCWKDFSPECGVLCALSKRCQKSCIYHTNHNQNVSLRFLFWMCCGGIFKWFLKLSAFIGVKSHRLHLFGFFPLWAFKCGLKLAAWINFKSHWLHLYDLAPLCALKCLLKSPAWIHIGCVWFFSTMYFQMCPQLLTALTGHKKSIFTLQADPEKSRDFIFQNPGILMNWKSRDPGIPGIPLGPGQHQCHASHSRSLLYYQCNLSQWYSIVYTMQPFCGFFYSRKGLRKGRFSPHPP